MSFLTKSGFLFGSFLILFPCILGAQVLHKPEPADNPNLPGNAAWSAACASEDFNEYFVNFTWSPPLVNANNLFVLELSDPTGDFDNPIALDTISDSNNEFDIDFSFALPEDTRGDAYRFRVRSTSPALLSEVSDPYPMYYIGYKDPILISQDGDGNIPPGGELQVCDGQPINLSPHNVPNPETYLYNWYDGSTLLTEKSHVLTVSSPGTFSVEIDYGANCSGSANTRSNPIQVTFLPPLGISISAQSDTNICNGETVILEANINDGTLFYAWFKDGIAVSTPALGEYTYTVNSANASFDGDYHVEIEGAGACAEASNIVSVTDAGNFTISLDQATTLYLLPTQNETISVSTTATNPTFEWYKDGVVIAGETTSSLVISDEGDYFVRVTQGGACSNSIIDSEITTALLPDSFSFAIDYVGGYTECQSTEANLGLSQIEAHYGSVTNVVTAQVEPDFSFQWQLDGSNIAPETTTSIMLIDPSENGSYVLTGSLGAYTVTSNSLNVRLTNGEILEISSTGTALCNGDTITISTTKDLSGLTFDWMRDGVSIDSSNGQIEPTETGSYQLVVQQDDCPLVSNTIEILPFDDSAITIDVADEFLFVQGTTVTITAEGALTYEWFDENNALISSENTVGITEPGTYLLVASIDNCNVTRTFTAILKDEFEVPNVITPNGDGINDLWLLPNIYSGNPNIRVSIFNELGVEVLRQANYQNNWPESSFAFPKQNMIFYYTIKDSGRTVKQGTITVIR